MVLGVCKALKMVLHSVNRIAYGIPTGNFYSIYLTSPRGMRAITDQFMVGQFI